MTHTQSERTMTGEWKTVKLGELGTIVGGATPSTRKHENYENGTIAWITPKDLSNHNERFISRGERNITETGLKSCSAQLMPKHSVLFSSRAPIGYVAIAANELCTNQGFKSIIPNSETDYLFLYYLLRYNKNKIEHLGSGTTFKEVSGSVMRNIEVRVPPLDVQRRIAAVLKPLDDKIELNARINERLERVAQALFKRHFVRFEPYGGTMPPGWRVCRADEYFDITIGKTPPRKEPQWFSEEKGNTTWISISDMGKSGAYISDSSEYLTPEAVERFNVCIVPDNTVILSFKLTVGRVAITDGKMTTNEAIAHFKTNKPEINEYLYLYLKSFRYETLGSTSSIATAVNSKIIKAMPFVVPSDEDIKAFHETVSPMFNMIKHNLRQSRTLARLRDVLLPRLMSGAVDVRQVRLNTIQEGGSR